MSRLARICLAVALSLPGSGFTATIIITDLEDVTFGDLPPTIQGVRQRMSFCVNSDPAGPFRLTAIGVENGRFEVFNGAQEAIPYQIYISRRRARLGREMFAGVTLNNLQARRLRSNGRCRPPRIWLSVLLDETALSRAPAGNYTGTLQITVAPE